MRTARLSDARRKLIVGFWAVSVAVILTLIWLNRDSLSVAYFEGWMRDHFFLASLIYVLLLSVRGVFLIPSTPLLFAGIVVFPPFWVWSLNMVGIVTSSTIVYTLVHWVGVDIMVRARYRERVVQLRGLMERFGIPVIVGWSLFPFVPTDVIVYTASTVRMQLWKCLLGVLIGEGILNGIYVVTGQGILALLQASAL